MPLKVNEIAGRKGWYEAKGTVRGKRIRRRFEARTKSEARAIANQLEASAWESDTDNPDPVAFENCALAYMRADKSTRYLAPLILHFKGRDVNKIKPGDIQDAARAIYPNAKAATRNRQAITPAQAVINFASERGLCSPIKVKRFKGRKPVRRAVDRDWIDAFMAEADPHIAALSLFMFTTAARLSEALSIEWTNIDFQTRKAYIAKTKMGNDRHAHLTDEMVAVLAGLDRSYGTVFRYTRAGYFYVLWKETCERAEIEYVPPHQAGRHSFATEMVVRNGVDPVIAAKAGGYSVRVLQEHYAHSEREDDAVDDVFGGKDKVRRVK